MVEIKKKKYFTHFKIHTQYSVCEGAIKINELTNYCKKLKIKSIGISDTNNLSGALEFSDSLSKHGTQPIIGTQIIFDYEGEKGLLTLIAKNKYGYKKLLELSSKSYIENGKMSFPHCNFTELYKINDGIIIMSGTINGLFGKLFNKSKYNLIEKCYKNLNNHFENNFYIEIQRHNDFNENNFEKFNLNLSYKYNIPIIASHEIFYIEKSMHDAHEALICIGNKSYLNDKNRITYSNNHYIKSDDEMIALFSDLPEALENNFNLPFRCSFRPTKINPILPNISSEKEGSADKKLVSDSNIGLLNKFKNLFCNLNEDPHKHKYFNEYKNRLDHELKIIIEMKYSSYFLIVSDYINWAKNNDIPVGPGRGSGAGSLVAWCLQITDVDPIKFNLIFERFLNPARISMPDFDIDFCEEKRDLVFEYLANKYKDSVAHIITFGKLKARMVIRDVGRVLGLSYGFVDNIAKMIPFDPSRPQSLTECINSEPRLQKLIKDDVRVKKLIDLSLKLEGLNRNVATHAAGVVIADKKLTDTVPLYKDHTSNLLLPSTQFDMYSAENAGLIKFDFLGLKTLTIIDKTKKLVHLIKKDFNLNKINYEDKKVFDNLASGNTIGLFQLESSGMKDALTNMKPTELEDIIALVALYRPGPMGNISIYNECKNNSRQPDYIHPLLEEILKPTYGVIIYQEQIMQIAQKLAGFTAAEADILRKAIGKKKRSEVEKQKMRFIEGAVNNGIKKDVAAGIFLKIEPFAEYGFNKSHAAAYAIIAYQTAFLKTHYPSQFFSASMSMDISNQKKLGEFFEELKRLKMNIVRPDINRCFADFKSSNGDFYYALGAIKNVGYEAISNIVIERENNGKFKSISDFINRVNPKDINKLQLEGLVKAGAFDSLLNNRQSLFCSIPKMINISKTNFENKSLNQKNLFGIDDNNQMDILIDKKDWKFEDRLNKEFEAVGFFISDHPLNQYKNIFEEFELISYEKFLNQKTKSTCNIAATILKVQEKKTSKGNPYAIVKFSDLNSVFEIFIFSEMLDNYRDMLLEGTSVILKLNQNISEINARNKITISNILPVSKFIQTSIDSIKFEIDSIEKIRILSENIQELGNTNVKIKYKYKNFISTFKLDNKRNIDRKTVDKLKKLDISSIIN